jgi:hypothetical protein
LTAIRHLTILQHAVFERCELQVPPARAHGRCRPNRPQAHEASGGAGKVVEAQASVRTRERFA